MKTYRKFFIFVVISVALWGVVYLPFRLETPGPDMSWVHAQRDLRNLVLPLNTTALQLPGEEACRGRPLLVVVVCSALANSVARQAIRRTWGHDRDNDVVRLLFLTGRAVNESLNAQVAAEASRHGDIIQEDFLDTYNNLTLKSAFLLKWANTSCLTSRYIMKVDDDMFVNLPNLVSLLQSKGHPRLLIGCLITGAVPIQDFHSKWYVPTSVFSDKTYPNYLSGTGYVFATDLVPILYRTALLTPFFYLEDIFITGICAQKAGLRAINHSGFSYQKRKKLPCLFRSLITAHGLTPIELHSMWVKVHDPSIKCKTKKKKSS